LLAPVLIAFLVQAAEFLLLADVGGEADDLRLVGSP
jgi:hypothetical protein